LALSAATLAAGGSTLIAGPASGLALVALIVGLVIRSPGWTAASITLLMVAYAQADPSLANAATATFAVGLVLFAEVAFLALAVVSSMPLVDVRTAVLGAGRVVVGGAVVVALVGVASSASFGTSAWLVPLGFGAAVAAIAALNYALGKATPLAEESSR
jgi:hypothetical protein